MDVIACILGDIIKPGDKLGNTPGANYENHKKITIFEQFYSMLKTGVCVEYDLISAHG